MPADDSFVDGPWSSSRVPGEDGRGRQIEHDRGRWNADSSGSCQERAPCRCLDARRIDDRGVSLREAPIEVVVKPPEGRARGALVGLVARDDRPVAVR